MHFSCTSVMAPEVLHNEVIAVYLQNCCSNEGLSTVPWSFPLSFISFLFSSSCLERDEKLTKIFWYDFQLLHMEKNSSICPWEWTSMFSHKLLYIINCMAMLTSTCNVQYLLPAIWCSMLVSVWWLNHWNSIQQITTAWQVVKDLAQTLHQHRSVEWNQDGQVTTTSPYIKYCTIATG